MKKFTAYDIEWNVEIDEVYEIFSKMTAHNAAELLNISEKEYSAMGINEKHELIRDRIHHNRISASDIADLPEMVEIPAEFGIVSEKDNMEDVTDWLSDKYGYCINGYKVKEM